MKPRTVVVASVTAAALVLAKFGAKLLAYGAAFFVTQSTVAFLSTPEVEKEMKAGFADVAADWGSWLNEWEDSSTATFQYWGARIAAEYVSEDELLEIYHAQAQTFQRIADDPVLNPICSDPSTLLPEFDATELGLDALTRITGRGFARRHQGKLPWAPPVDLETADGEWSAYFTYLQDAGASDVLYMFSAVMNEEPITNEAMCVGQASMYRGAATNPQEWIGRMRLIDFVRSLDVIAAKPRQY